VVVWQTASRPGVRRDHCDTELKLVLFACGGRHDGTLLMKTGSNGRQSQVLVCRRANTATYISTATKNDAHNASATFIHYRLWLNCSCNRRSCIL